MFELIALLTVAWAPLPENVSVDFSLPSSLPSQYEPGHPGTATIVGRVTLRNLPPIKKIRLTKDTDQCGKERIDETYLYTVDPSGAKPAGLKNVVVWIDSIRSGKDEAKTPLVLKHMTCLYEPRVMVAMVGDTLEIKNYDAVQHNTHGYLLPFDQDPWRASGRSPDSRLTIFNVAFPVKGLSIKRHLEKAGLIDLLNDAGHPWMQAWLLVFDHPYATISDAEGRFVLDQVPDGTYTVKAWHEASGLWSQQITVSHDSKIELNVAY